MALPPFQKLLLPILQIIGEAKEPMHMGDLVDAICKKLEISPEDQKKYRKDKPKTKSNTIIRNRVDWACGDLRNAKLISTKSAFSTITDAGQKILQENPSDINRKYLYEKSGAFKEHLDKLRSDSKEKRENSKAGSESEQAEEKPIEKENVSDNIDSSPRERIDNALEEINDNLWEDIVNRIQSLNPRGFEQLILDLILKMDYGDVEASERTGKSGDGGIDGIIRDNRLGLDPIYLQAKRYAHDHQVSVSEVNSFIGAVDRRGSNKGVFVTTSSFSKPAREAVKETQKEILLINGDKLTELMIRYKVGIQTEETHTIQKLDSDYFDELDEE